MKRTAFPTVLMISLIAWVAAPVWARPAAQTPADRAGAEQPKTGRFGDPSVFGMNYQDYFYGVVSKIEPDALVLTKTKIGVPQTIRLTKKTKFIRDRKKSALADLKVGEMVYVDTKTDKKTGAMTARKVVSGMDVTVAP